MRAFLLLPFLLAATACAGPGLPRLGSGEFVANDVNGVPLVAGTRLTLVLGEDGQASGNGGCNSFTTTYKLQSQERIDFGPIAARVKDAKPDLVWIGDIGLEGNMLLDAMKKIADASGGYAYQVDNAGEGQVALLDGLRRNRHLSD